MIVFQLVVTDEVVEDIFGHEGIIDESKLEDVESHQQWHFFRFCYTLNPLSQYIWCLILWYMPSCMLWLNDPTLPLTKFNF